MYVLCLSNVPTLFFGIRLALVITMNEAAPPASQSATLTAHLLYADLMVSAKSFAVACDDSIEATPSPIPTYLLTGLSQGALNRQTKNTDAHNLHRFWID